MNHKINLAIIIPCYNEQGVLKLSIPEIVDYLNSNLNDLISFSKSFILLVDDGSSDRTLDEAKELVHAAKFDIRVLSLCQNVGHQKALFAGLNYASNLCDCAISIDADLQDDICVMREMVEKYISGSHLVLGVRNNRETDTFFKRFSANSFYKLMSLMGLELVPNHADYRLMSSKALKNLSKYKDPSLFLRGLVLQLHKDISFVTYSRKKRIAGVSKYPLKQMVRLAWNGISSMSFVPLRLVLVFGILSFIFSIGILVYSLVAYSQGNVVPGWTSLAVSIYMVGGLTMFSIGLIGEYLGKVFIQSKNYPLYHINTITTKEGERRDEDRK